MGQLFYLVVRVFLKNGKYNHSIQEIRDVRQAKQRYYNIIAADLADNDVLYQYCSITDCYGNNVDGLLPVVDDRRPAPEPEPQPEPEVIPDSALPYENE